MFCSEEHLGDSLDPVSDIISIFWWRNLMIFFSQEFNKPGTHLPTKHLKSPGPQIVGAQPYFCPPWRSNAPKPILGQLCSVWASGGWATVGSFFRKSLPREVTGYEEREDPCAGDGVASISTLPGCIAPVHLRLAANMITYPAQARREEVVNNSSPGWFIGPCFLIHPCASHPPQPHTMLSAEEVEVRGWND